MVELHAYRHQLEAKHKLGTATEHTHRSALESLFESLFQNVLAVNDPKKTRYSAVDFAIMRGENEIGRVETKKIGENLDRIERGEQMKRYLLGDKNLLLTNYLEFRWYARGEKRRTATLARIDKQGNFEDLPGGEEQLGQLLKDFIAYQAPPITNSKELAQRMAFFARIMSEVILQALHAEYKGESRSCTLSRQLKSFQDVLVHDLDGPQFADLYAQTICYGLFAARMRLPDSHQESQNTGLFSARISAPDDEAAPFNRLTALYGIRNPFLKTMFGYLAVTHAHPDLAGRSTKSPRC